MLKNEAQGKKVSRPIIRISVISISLAVVVNLITIAVVTGFQREVREKVTGFNSHLFIMQSAENSIYESEPILKKQEFYPTIHNETGIKHIQYVAYKPILFQSDKKKQTHKLPSGKDTSYFQQEIIGGLLKGVDQQYNLSFFSEHLKKGRLPRFNANEISYELLISKRIAEDLHLKVNDRLRAFFVKNQPVKRVFTIVGIYETGLEEFDKRITVGDIRIVQELNDWGVKASIRISDSLHFGQLTIQAEVTGGNGLYRYDWGDGFDTYSGFYLYPTRDTVIRLIASDYWSDIRENVLHTSIPDTAYLKITVQGDNSTYSKFILNSDQTIKRNYLNQRGQKYRIGSLSKQVTCEQIDGKGSSSSYVGGFEIEVKEWEQMPAIYKRLKKRFELIPTKQQEQLTVKSIMETESDIFVWLGFLDLNVLIILTLMILIGIINMGSALLVLILVRTNFIGILKSMGASNWTIRKIFLLQAGFLILRGLIYGNIIGLLLCGLQYFFDIIQLDPAVYYLSSVPIHLTLTSWLLLNVGTLVICLSALIIPSIVITRIQVIKAIRFN